MGIFHKNIRDAIQEIKKNKLQEASKIVQRHCDDIGEIGRDIQGLTPLLNEYYRYLVNAKNSLAGVAPSSARTRTMSRRIEPSGKYAEHCLDLAENKIIEIEIKINQLRHKIKLEE